MKKKQAIMKNEMDKRMADLVKFSKSFKVKIENLSLEDVTYSCCVYS